MKTIITLLLFTSIQSFANTRYYVVPETGTGKPVIIGADGFVPPNVLADAPVDKDGNPFPIEAVTIQDVVNPDSGIITKVAVPDQTKADQVRAKEKTDREAAESADKAARADEKQALKKCLKAAPTAGETRDCLQKLIKRLYADVEN